MLTREMQFLKLVQEHEGLVLRMLAARLTDAEEERLLSLEEEIETLCNAAADEYYNNTQH